MSDNTIYKKCCVYKISSNVNTDMIYFGSTKNFNKRMSQHISHYKRYLNNKFNYLTVFDIFDLGDYSKEIVKFYNGITRKDLQDFETEFIENNKCINIRQSKKSYDKDYDKIYNKEYYETKKENNKEYNKERYENDKERLNKQNACEICKGNFTTQNKSQHFKTYKHTAAQELLNNQKKEQETRTEKQEEPKKKIIIKMKNNSNITNINITNNS